MKTRKTCTNCQHYIPSTKECSNIKASEKMIYGITNYRVGCDEHKEGRTTIELIKEEEHE